MKLKSSPIITGTFYLCIAGIITRLLGFVYRVWLGNLIGPEELGIYQLVFPVFSICLALCGGPFQTAISKFTAEHALNKPGKARMYFLTAFLISLIIAIAEGILILLFRSQIAVFFLLNERCAQLLPYIAICIPLSAVHSCISGWYYGIQNASVPAFSNILEQTIRMLFVFFLVQSQVDFSVIHVCLALAAGELAAFLFSSFMFFRRQSKEKNISPCKWRTRSFHADSEYLRNLYRLIWPLAANRLSLSFLQSIEAVMIPSRLILFGLSESLALSLYGTLTGMAMNFIYFPTAITGSYSLLLLPDIAQAWNEKRYTHIRKASALSILAAFLTGLLFWVFFLCFGIQIGQICFPGTRTGEYLRTLSWLCPFIYSNGIIVSILHGLCRTAQTFRTQFSAYLIRLAITVFLVPYYGMTCYFIALLITQIYMNLVNGAALSKNLAEKHI